MINKEMLEHYIKRTDKHINLVRKYHGIISSFNLPQILPDLFELEAFEHDRTKYNEPELIPYVYITWKYLHPDHEVPNHIKDKMHEATFHHIKNNKHHPEYWDDSSTLCSLNRNNRDAPSGNIVSGSKMPLTYIAAMIADWFAMSEEKNTNINDWLDKNINIRWAFDDYQVDFMKLLINLVFEHEKRNN